MKSDIRHAAGIIAIIWSALLVDHSVRLIWLVSITWTTLSFDLAVLAASLALFILLRRSGDPTDDSSGSRSD